MTLSPKERLLSALYVEYQAPVSDFDKITFEFLEMDSEVFADSLRKLAVEELVSGVEWIPPTGRIQALNRKYLYLTRRGVEEAKSLLKIKEQKQGAILKELARLFGLAGEIVLKKFAEEIITKL